MTRDDKRPRQPRLTDGEREKARRAKRRKKRQDDHLLLRGFPRASGWEGIAERPDAA